MLRTRSLATSGDATPNRRSAKNYPFRRCCSAHFSVGVVTILALTVMYNIIILFLQNIIQLNIKCEDLLDKKAESRLYEICLSEGQQVNLDGKHLQVVPLLIRVSFAFQKLSTELPMVAIIQIALILQ